MGSVDIVPKQDHLDAAWLAEFFDIPKDYFLSPGFAKGVLLQPNSTDIRVSSEAQALLETWGQSWIDTLAVSFPPGPYFCRGNALCRVLRLYDDGQWVPLVSLRPAKDGTYGIYFFHAFYAVNILATALLNDEGMADFAVLLLSLHVLLSKTITMYVLCCSNLERTTLKILSVRKAYLDSRLHCLSYFYGPLDGRTA